MTVLRWCERCAAYIAPPPELGSYFAPHWPRCRCDSRTHATHKLHGDGGRKT